MPEHPLHPRFQAIYDRAFHSDRKALGLNSQNFDHFFQDVERHITDYPWEYSKEVPDSGGTRMLRTRDAFPDIPPLYVYYKVNVPDNRILFLGLSPAWSASETV